MSLVPEGAQPCDWCHVSHPGSQGQYFWVGPQGWMGGEHPNIHTDVLWAAGIQYKYPEASSLCHLEGPLHCLPPWTLPTGGKLTIIQFQSKLWVILPCIQVQCGLARYAEQAGEAIHVKVKPVIQHNKWKISHKNHAVRQQRAIVEFSSNNI